MRSRHRHQNKGVVDGHRLGPDIGSGNPLQTAERTQQEQIEQRVVEEGQLPHTQKYDQVVDHQRDQQTVQHTLHDGERVILLQEGVLFPYHNG